MKYHFERPLWFTSMYGKHYECNHPVYSVCTLYQIEERGLAVIQQRYNPESKVTWWSEIDPWLTDAIYLNDKFRDLFDKYAGKCTDGLYPTITIRQLMWALRMKPLLKERWETCFDRHGV